MMKYLLINSNRNNKKKYIFNNIIIFFLILNIKTIINFSHRNKIIQLIYIIIKYLNIKTWQGQKQLKTLILSEISIIYEQQKNVNNKNKHIKTILQYTYLSFSFIKFKKMRY